MNFVRAISTEGDGRIKHFTIIRELLKTDRKFRMFFEQETNEVPEFYVSKIKKDLGALWEWLPDGAINHDKNAYLKSAAQPKLMAI
jgi:hypothetical protein